MQEELQMGRKLSNWNYKEKTDAFMKTLQELNQSLRKVLDIS